MFCILTDFFNKRDIIRLSAQLINTNQLKALSTQNINKRADNVDKKHRKKDTRQRLEQAHTQNRLNQFRKPYPHTPVHVNNIDAECRRRKKGDNLLNCRTDFDF